MKAFAAVLCPVPPLRMATRPELISVPLIDLFVSVCVSVVPTTAPAGAATLEIAPVDVVTVTRPVAREPGSLN